MIDRIHYISQGITPDDHLKSIERILLAGAKWIQLRLKNTDEHTLLEVAENAVELCNRYDAKLIINDYPSIALKVGAHGVHLGLEDMSVKEARAILGADRIVGGTANTIEQVIQRIDEKVDYVGVGPFRFTTTKEKLSPILGAEGFREIVKRLSAANLSIPIIAIGGIEIADVAHIMETGVYGVAVSGALTNQPDLSLTYQQIQKEINTQLV
ncbi:thiamine phosphate synthase [Pedobacter sp.]|uniref:thiamine phosphate synthase n=1 Tax=Pedobacter sp. TaxID=1411316 RepID=UPI003BADB369